jgi:hypothetical protein
MKFFVLNLWWDEILPIKVMGGCEYLVRKAPQAKIVLFHSVKTKRIYGRLKYSTLDLWGGGLASFYGGEILTNFQKTLHLTSPGSYYIYLDIC